MAENLNYVRYSAQQELWAITGTEQHEQLRTVLCCLRTSVQEDLCYALIAYLRFGIVRKFKNQLMQTLFYMLMEHCKECATYQQNEE